MQHQMNKTFRNHSSGTRRKKVRHTLNPTLKKWYLWYIFPQVSTQEPSNNIAGRGGNVFFFRP